MLGNGRGSLTGASGVGQLLRRSAPPALLLPLNGRSPLLRPPRRPLPPVTTQRGGADSAERLRVVFVGTEVAPWSKVGGLADVLAALPAALAARGHHVVTVTPRYAPYPDTDPTGIAVPLQLPPHCGRPPPPLEQQVAAALRTPRRRGRTRGEQCKGEAAAEAALTLSAAADELLCGSGGNSSKSSLVLPHEAHLFATDRKGVHHVFVDHPMLRTEDIYGPGKGDGGALTYTDSGSGIANLDLRYSILCQAALGAAALVPELHAGGACGHFDGEESEDDEGGIVFVANDWQTALQLLRLKYVVQRWGRSDAGEEQHEHEQLLLSPELEEYEAILRRRLGTASAAMCIHNLAYQGIYPATTFPGLCLPSSAAEALVTEADWRQVLRRHARPAHVQLAGSRALGCACGASGCTCAPVAELPTDAAAAASLPGTVNLNFMRSALLCADEIVTVSPSYAQEIQNSPEMGCGLQGILRERGVTGIMNGIDVEEWDPQTDPLLPPAGRFGSHHRSLARGKAHMLALVQRRLGLAENPNAALAVFVGRLTEQKGVDVLLGALPHVLAPPPTPFPRPVAASPPPQQAGPLQIAILGTGDAWMQAALSGLELSFPGQAVGIPDFSEEMAHWLLAAAAYVVMPSRFEPCGLVAQCGARFGAVPIVTAVGGLRDLVTPDVGIALPPLSPAGDAVGRAADVRRLAAVLREAADGAGGEEHRRRQRRCVRLDLSWDGPAEQWERVLRRLARRRSGGRASPRWDGVSAEPTVASSHAHPHF